MSGSRTTEGIDPNEARISRVLATAYQRERAAQAHENTPMTFGDIFDPAPDDGEELMKAKQEAVIRMLCFIFQKGPHPGNVMRLVYLLAARLKSDLILNMNGSELADLFGETRAAWSARNQKMFTGYLRACGSHAAKDPRQKSDSVCAKYAVAQLGNTNRRGKFKSNATKGTSSSTARHSAAAG